MAHHGLLMMNDDNIIFSNKRFTSIMVKDLSIKTKELININQRENRKTKHQCTSTTHIKHSPGQNPKTLKQEPPKQNQKTLLLPTKNPNKTPKIPQSSGVLVARLLSIVLHLFHHFRQGKATGRRYQELPELLVKFLREGRVGPACFERFLKQKTKDQIFRWILWAFRRCCSQFKVFCLLCKGSCCCMKGEWNYSRPMSYLHRLSIYTVVGWNFFLSLCSDSLMDVELHLHSCVWIPRILKTITSPNAKELTCALPTPPVWVHAGRAPN